MTRPEGWPVTPELSPPATRWPLRFTVEEIEQDYQAWRLDHVRPFTRFAMYAATSAAVCAWIAVLFGALVDLRGLTLVLIPAEVALLVAGAAIARKDDLLRWLMPASATVNLAGGFLAIGMTAPLHNTSLMGACVTMSAYFGLTMFRLPPRLAFASVAPYVVLTAVLAGIWHARGTVGDQDFVLGLFIPLTAMVTGMVVNLAMEWITRQTYVDHLTIESQQDALFDERTNIARFMSPEIAETVHRTGIQESLRCEMFSLTAVSIDLRGFTSYTQRHGAEYMVSVLQDYYAAVIESAHEFGATVKDFAGDGALVLVGAPFPRADHTRAGLRLARDMLVRVREVTSRWATPDSPLGAGIGIASGECAVGAIGSLSQLEYAAVGTAVNLSARLCDIAKDGQILMAPGTARALEESPGWRREIVTLSGVPESVEVTIEDTLHQHQMVPHDRPTSPGIPRQPGAHREAPVAFTE